MDLAKEAYEKAAEAQDHLNQNFSAGTSLEKAAAISLKQERGESLDEAVDYYRRASEYFQLVQEDRLLSFLMRICVMSREATWTKQQSPSSARPRCECVHAGIDAHKKRIEQSCKAAH